MFVNFFLELRQAKVPVSLREYLTLMEAMDSTSPTTTSRIFITCHDRRW